MIYRFFSIILMSYFSIGATSSYADEKSLAGATTSTAPVYLRKNNDSQMPGKTFERLIKAFQAGDSGAKAALCELRAQSFANGNIILVKKIEEHRYRNNYTCDETAKEQLKTNIKTEQTVATVNTAQDAAKSEEQERQAITITAQKLATTIREKQERAAANAARVAAEKLERERLAAGKAEEAKALAAKATAAKEQQKKKIEQERLAVEAARKAEEKLERERLLAAIAEEKRIIASKAEQERIAAIQAAKEHREKERIKQAQRAAEEARLAAVKQEQERIASAATQTKKDTAAKAVIEQATVAKASKERLAKERVEQVQAAAKTARLVTEKQGHEHIATPKDTARTTVSKPEPMPPTQPHTVEHRKPDSPPTPPKPGQPMPGLNITSFSGMPVSPDYYRGSVLLIDFFAPWCQVCRRHIPKIVNLHNKFKKQGLQVLGLNVDNTDKTAVADFSSELYMSYPLARVDESIQAKLGIRAVPAVYIIDKKGRIAGVFHTINDETDRTIESIVKKLLAGE